MPRSGKCDSKLDEILREELEGDPFQEASDRNQEALEKGENLSLKERLQSNWGDAQYILKSEIRKMGPAGDKIVREIELGAGLSAEGAALYEEIESELLSGLTKSEQVVLGNLMHAMRIEAIDKNSKAVAQDIIKDGALGEVLRIDTEEGMARSIKILGAKRASKMVAQMQQAPGKGLYIIIKKQGEKAKETYGFSKYKTREEAEVEAKEQVQKVLEESLVLHPQDMTAKEARVWRVKFHKATPAIYTKMHVRAKKIFQVYADQLTMMRKEGLISEEAYLNMEKVGDYSPRRYIQYLDPHGEHDALEAITSGSTQATLRDPSTLLREYILRLHDRVARNRSATMLWDFIKKNPDHNLVTEAKKVGDKLYTMDGKPVGGTFGKIHVRIDGEDKIMVMRKDLADQWNRFDPIWHDNHLNTLRILSGTPILKAMATGLNPGFALVNLPMDMFFSYFRSGKEFSSKAPIGIAQLIGDMWRVRKDVWHTGKLKGRALKYLKEGGMMSFLTAQGLAKGRKGIAYMIEHPGLKKAEHALSFFGQKSELWVRLAVRERVLRNRTKNGKLPETEDMRKEATWIARRYLDFAQGGSLGKTNDKFFPYLNAMLRATTGMFETLSGGDSSVTGKQRAENRAIAMWKLSSFFALTSAVYVTNMLFHGEMMEGMDDKDYGTYIPIPIPWLDEKTPAGTRRAYFKIRIDPGQAAVQSLAMLVISKFMQGFNTATGDDLQAEERIWNMRDDVLLNNVKNMIPFLGNFPPTLKALVVLFLNFDLWRGKYAYRGPEMTAKSAEVNWNTHPLFAKGFKAISEWTGGKEGSAGLLELSPARTQLAFEQILTPSNSVIKLINVSTRAIDYMLEQANDEDRHEINKAQKFERLDFLSKFPGTARLINYSKPFDQQSRKKAQQIREDGLGVKQHVKNKVNGLMNELNRLDVHAGTEGSPERRVATNAKNILIGKALEAIKESKLTETQKNSLKRSVKTQVDFKDRIGYLPEARYWREVFVTRDTSIQVEQVVDKMLESSPEKQRILFQTLKKLPIWKGGFIRQFRDHPRVKELMVQ